MLTNYLDLSNMVFVITGAGSGMGYATAVLCNNFGAKLILLDKDKDGLLETASHLKKWLISLL